GRCEPILLRIFHLRGEEGRDARLGCGGLLFCRDREAPLVSVGALVEGIEVREMSATVFIDERDLGEIPGGEANGQFPEHAITGGHLEAPSSDGDRAVAEPLPAALLTAEEPAQLIPGWTVTLEMGRFQEALQRGVLQLGVDALDVVLLEPREGGAIEQRERQLFLAFELGHEPPFDLPPKGLLLAVVFWRVGQRRLVNDAETLKALGRFGRQHGLAVVREQRAGYAALHEGLHES